MDVTSRQKLLIEGSNDRRIAEAVKAGELVRLERGLYGFPPLLGAQELHRARIAAHPDALLALESAALLHGLELRSLPELVETVIPGKTNSWRRGGRLVRRMPLAPCDVVDVGGRQATSIARTLVDLARLRPDLSARVPWECALWRARKRDELVELQAQISDVLQRQGPLRGIALAREMHVTASAWSESPKETESFVVIKSLGLPVPVQQFAVHDATGGLIGWTDFAWPGLGVVGEYDGKDKYDRLARPGESPRQVMLREKRRQQRMELRGWVFARWDDTHLRNPVALRAVITSAFDVAALRGALPA